MRLKPPQAKRTSMQQVSPIFGATSEGQVFTSSTSDESGRKVETQQKKYEMRMTGESSGILRQREIEVSAQDSETHLHRMFVEKDRDYKNRSLITNMPQSLYRQYMKSESSVVFFCNEFMVHGDYDTINESAWSRDGMNFNIVDEEKTLSYLAMNEKLSFGQQGEEYVINPENDDELHLLDYSAEEYLNGTWGYYKGKENIVANSNTGRVEIHDPVVANENAGEAQPRYGSLPDALHDVSRDLSTSHHESSQEVRVETSCAEVVTKPFSYEGCIVEYMEVEMTMVAPMFKALSDAQENNRLKEMEIGRKHDLLKRYWERGYRLDANGRAYIEARTSGRE